MKRKGIVARILVCVMLLGMFTQAQAQVQTQLPVGGGNTITVEVGQVASLSVSAPHGVTLTNVWLDGEIDDGITATASLSGNSATVHVAAASNTQGRSFARTLHMWGTMTPTTNNDDNTTTAGTPVPWSEERVIAINVTQAPAQNATLRQTSPDRYITMQPGVPQLVTITMHNYSQHIARNVRIVPESHFDFIIEAVGTANNINISSNSSRDFQVRITPHAAFEGPTLPIPVSFRFENNRNELLPATTATVRARLERATVQEPYVILENFVTNPTTVNAGDSFTLTATLRNLSEVTASNAQVTINTPADSGISLRGSNTAFVGTVGANGTATVTFELTARANIAEVPQPAVTLTLRHDERTEPYTYSVTVGGEAAVEGEPSLVVTNITRLTAVFGVGQTANIQVTIVNQGDAVARNVNVSAAPGAGIVPVSQGIWTVRELGIGESYVFNFAFMPTVAAGNHFHNIGFTISCADSDSFAINTGFNVYNPDDEDDSQDPDTGRLSVPRIIISNYTVNPMMVMANTEFDLSLTFMNTHADRSIGNIRVTWQVHGVAGGGTPGQAAAAGATFTPVGASNTIFIDYIPPRGTIEHNLRLFAIPDAAPGNHTITVSFDYEDMEARPFTAEELIGVNVRQQSRLELIGVNIQEFASVGENVLVMFQVMNAGRTQLHNLRVWIEGDGIDGASASEIFQNFTGGAFNMFWGSFVPWQEGPITAYVKASFEDAMGELHEIVYEFPMQIMGGFGGDFGGDFGFGDFDRPGFGGPWDDPWGEDDDEGGFIAWFTGLWTNPWFLGGGGVVVAAGGITAAALVTRRRRNREMSEFDNDDDDFLN